MDTQSKRLPLMLLELNERFNDRVTAQYGGNISEIIGCEEGPKSSRQKGGAILMETCSKVLSILKASGLDG